MVGTTSELCLAASARTAIEICVGLFFLSLPEHPQPALLASKSHGEDRRRQRRRPRAAHTASDEDEYYRLGKKGRILGQKKTEPTRALSPPFLVQPTAD
jgi:hypothetical protein